MRFRDRAGRFEKIFPWAEREDLDCSVRPQGFQRDPPGLRRPDRNSVIIKSQPKTRRHPLLEDFKPHRAMSGLNPKLFRVRAMLMVRVGMMGFGLDVPVGPPGHP